jgi:hypothetical protein
MGYVDGWQDLKQALDLIKLALDKYWDFMGVHAFLGTALTVGTLNQIARLVRGPRPVSRQVIRGRPIPVSRPGALSEVQQVTQRPSSPQTEGPSRYDRLLKDDGEV